MLQDCKAVAIIAVSDIDRARAFYADVLCLGSPREGPGGTLDFKAGGTRLLVYPSEFAGTNKANAVVFEVADGIETIVADIKGKGGAFAHYPDMPGLTLNGDIHEAGEAKLVWVEDPDGNLLHLVQGMD